MRITLCAAALLLLTVLPAFAQEVENGTLAAAIRAGGHPCAQVLEKEHQGGSQWLVRCNSGRFQVRLKQGGSAEVTPLD